MGSHTEGVFPARDLTKPTKTIILTSIRHSGPAVDSGVFEPADIDAMIWALDLAILSRPDIGEGTLARHIIAVAKTGERDVEALCSKALAVFGRPRRQ